MLKTFALRGREIPLTIYGPHGLEDLMGTLRRVFGRLSYPVRIVELGAGARLERDGYVIEAFPVDHGVSAVGYAFVEEERPGRFDVEVADRLGVPAGRERGMLQRGERVELADGRVVEPSDVLGEARAGRKVVLTGDTAPAASVVEAARGRGPPRARGDVPRRGTRPSARDVALDGGRGCARAQEAGVKLLALTHVSTRYFAHQVVEEATQLFAATVVPRDFDLVTIPFPERGEPALVRSGARTAKTPADAAGTLAEPIL